MMHQSIWPVLHKQAVVLGKKTPTRHPGETTPSIRQGSTTPPSRQAVGLFRQGAARPRASTGHNVWDTRTSAAPVGAMNATFTFHLPKAYAEEAPDRPRLAPKSVRRRLSQTVNMPYQDVKILNPQVLAEAHRRPKIRTLITDVGKLVRAHQAPSLEQGVKRGLIPPGTHPSTATRAYKHAALRAIHKAGLGDYDTKMDAAAKAEFAPLSRFMFYAHRRVFDHLNQGSLKGAWAPFRNEFGQLYRQKKHGKLTGHERMRMRPTPYFIKRAPFRWLVDNLGDGGDKSMPLMKTGGVPPAAIARIGGSTIRQPDGLYRVLPLGDRAKLMVDKSRDIAGTALAKADFGFRLGGDYSTDPKRQLMRAIKPRLRRMRPRLRLNTQRDLRHVLNGGVTRQERWQLGATAFKQAPLGKSLALGLLGAGLAGYGTRLAARGFATRQARLAGSRWYKEALKRTTKKQAVREGIVARNIRLASIRTPRRLVTAAALIGGGLGLRGSPKSPTLPPLYQSAAEPLASDQSS